MRIRGISHLILCVSGRGVSSDKSTRRFRYASSRTCVRGKIHRCRNSKEERDEREWACVRACVIVIRIKNRRRTESSSLSPSQIANYRRSIFITSSLRSNTKNKKKKKRKRSRRNFKQSDVTKDFSLPQCSTIFEIKILQRNFFFKLIYQIRNGIEN